MNIFVLDYNPVTAAQYHIDKHVVKMVLEYAQLLSTAHAECGSKHPDMYAPTHRNHPSAIWTRQSTGNYEWLYQLFKATSDEYTRRYSKTHKTWVKLGSLLSVPPLKLHKADVQFTRDMLAMPLPCKQHDDDVAMCYRYYYRTNKQDIAHWRYPSKQPFWW